MAEHLGGKGGGGCGRGRRGEGEGGGGEGGRGEGEKGGGGREGRERMGICNNTVTLYTYHCNELYHTVRYQVLYHSMLRTYGIVYNNYLT